MALLVTPVLRVLIFALIQESAGTGKLAYIET